MTLFGFADADERATFDTLSSLQVPTPSGRMVPLQQFADFAQRHALPTAVSFRRQMLFPADHPCFIGDVGLGINPALLKRVADADQVLLVGGRMSENPSQAYTLLDIPVPKQKLVHVHPDAAELGRVYRPTLAINTSPAAFAQALAVEDDEALRGRVGVDVHAELERRQRGAVTGGQRAQPGKPGGCFGGGNGEGRVRLGQGFSARMGRGFR